ncbi:MAG: DUF3987 domain-containing protein [Desulfotomaculales bacterium]
MEAREAATAEARKNKTSRPKKPEEPRMVELYATDTTVEALAESLSYNPHGLLLLLDELSGWVNGLNQYKGGRGSDREAYLSFWNCTTAKINRKNKPPIILERPFVAVTGCLVPSALKTLTAEYGEDGFIHRILFAYPDFAASPWQEGTISARAWEAYRKLFRQLWDLPATPGNPVVLELTPEAYSLWVEMFNQLVTERAQPDFPDYLHGPWAKMPSQAARLALIIHLCELVAAQLDSDEPPQLGPVDEFAMAKAWLLVDYFKSHAKRVYSELRESPEDKLIRRILDWARRHNRTRFTVRELVTARICDTASQAEQLLRRMKERGLGRLERIRTGSRGRPTVVFNLLPYSALSKNPEAQ